MPLRIPLFILISCALAACAGPGRQLRALTPERPVFVETGEASWYGRSHQGRKTANGEAYDRRALTAAHRSLPLDSIVRVTNVENGKTVKLRINDRGPYVKGRIIDLSAQAAKELGMKDDGIAKVKVESYASDQPDNNPAGQ